MGVFSELNQANNRNGDLLTEISRLQAENAKLRAQSDTEPVAWREALEFIAEGQDAGRHDGLPEPCPAHDAETMWAVACEALRATPPPPPRPDTSAGLIEAAEIAEALASDFSGRPIRNVTDILSGLAKNFRNRARSADRSGT